jgi:hypothetical protein
MNWIEYLGLFGDNYTLSVALSALTLLASVWLVFFQNHRDWKETQRILNEGREEDDQL